jgi:riboflavin kinase / FMN adenylyltransferase
MKPQINLSRVIQALSRGDLSEANKLSGSFYSIRALVVHGNELGRRLGFPTANLEILDNQPLLLADGVYAVTIKLNNTVYKGMANVGFRPTIDGKTRMIEVNLFDFSGDLYGQTLDVQFVGRIRDEKKFNTLDELVAQIHHDKQHALTLLP